MSEDVDLFTGTFRDGWNCNIWKDDESVFVTIGYVNICIPIESWKDFSRIVKMSEAKRAGLESGNVEEMHKVNEEIRTYNKEVELNICPECGGNFDESDCNCTDPEDECPDE